MVIVTSKPLVLSERRVPICFVATLVSLATALFLTSASIIRFLLRCQEALRLPSTTTERDDFRCPPCEADSQSATVLVLEPLRQWHCRIRSNCRVCSAISMFFSVPLASWFLQCQPGPLQSSERSPLGMRVSCNDRVAVDPFSEMRRCSSSLT